MQQESQASKSGKQVLCKPERGHKVKELPLLVRERRELPWLGLKHKELPWLDGKGKELPWLEGNGRELPWLGLEHTKNFRCANMYCIPSAADRVDSSPNLEAQE